MKSLICSFLGGKIILKWILEQWDGEGVDWLDLTQERARWGRLL
jgi:hypothetical protein